jgi:hypothetical protein
MSLDQSVRDVLACTPRYGVSVGGNVCADFFEKRAGEAEAQAAPTEATVDAALRTHHRAQLALVCGFKGDFSVGRQRCYPLTNRSCETTLRWGGGALNAAISR